MIYNATFNSKFHHGGQWYWWRKSEYPCNTTNILYHRNRIEYISLWAEIKLTTANVPHGSDDTPHSCYIFDLTFGA